MKKMIEKSCISQLYKHSTLTNYMELAYTISVGTRVNTLRRSTTTVTKTRILDIGTTTVRIDGIKVGIAL